MMAHAQKPDFVFRRNGRVHLNWRERQFSPTIGSRGVRISGSNAGYTMFRGSVNSTGYPLHSPGTPSLSPPCFTVWQHISTELYNFLSIIKLPTLHNSNSSEINTTTQLFRRSTLPVRDVTGCIKHHCRPADASAINPYQSVPQTFPAVTPYDLAR